MMREQSPKGRSMERGKTRRKFLLGATTTAEVGDSVALGGQPQSCPVPTYQLAWCWHRGRKVNSVEDLGQMWY